MAKIFYHTATDEAVGAYSATLEKGTSLTPPAGSTDMTVGGIGTLGELGAVFISPSGEPNEAGAWPSDVEVDIDVPQMDSTSSYGFLTLGNGAGGIARVSADGSTESERIEQNEEAFTTPGLKTATFSALSAGAASDRVAAVMAVQKTFGHGNDQLDVRADADGIIQGGWAGPVAPGPDGVVTGTITIAPATVQGTVTIATSPSAGVIEVV